MPTRVQEVGNSSPNQKQRDVRDGLGLPSLTKEVGALHVRTKSANPVATQRDALGTSHVDSARGMAILSLPTVQDKICYLAYNCRKCYAPKRASMESDRTWSATRVDDPQLKRDAHRLPTDTLWALDSAVHDVAELHPSLPACRNRIAEIARRRPPKSIHRKLL